MSVIDPLALLACLGFSAVGMWSWCCLELGATAIARPQVLFFFVLVLNTYFSIKCFSAIGRLSGQQRILDLVLGTIYLIMALSIGRSPAFEASALVLFVVATLKYVLLEKRVHLSVIDRKIQIDTLGSILCFAGLTASLFGYSLESAWATTTVFVLANVYLLFVKPMYQKDTVV